MKKAKYFLSQMVMKKLLMAMETVMLNKKMSSNVKKCKKMLKGFKK